MSQVVNVDLGKKGLIVNGGGCAAAFGAGVLKQLRVSGIDVDEVAGVSAGTLDAAKYCENAEDECIADWQEFERRGPSYVFNRMDWVRSLSRGYLFENKGLCRMIDRINFNKIHASRYNYEVVVYNKTLGQFELISIRDLEKVQDMSRYVLASCSMRGVFPRVYINETLYSDGQIFEPALEAMMQRGCDTIFLVLNRHRGKEDFASVPSKGLFDELGDSGRTMNDYITQRVLNRMSVEHKDFSVVCADDSRDTLPGLPRLISSFIESAKRGSIDFLPHRLVVIDPARNIETLDFHSFKSGDITAAIEHGYLRAAEILDKLK